ncbi:O-methyltransferase [Candidatus Uabimicrobium sp. HlEnr_7]|uniref:O-methyltransferase n=1 Tax=Candidatus Uabimicrobium helgolandensis TaxID=3095367 RepID=UPI003555D7A4
MKKIKSVIKNLITTIASPVKTQIVRELSEHITRVERNLYRQLIFHQDLKEKLGYSIANTRGWCISPDIGIFLLDLLDQYSPKSILELGCGASSLVIGSYCIKNSGQLLSLEHQISHLQHVQAMIEEKKYSQVVTLVHSELEKQKSLYSSPFYSPKALTQHVSNRFDFVFIDGPPKQHGEQIRGNFLPLYQEFLQSNCIIVLDDYVRQGERQFVKKWLELGYVEIVEENTILEKHAVVLKSLL